MAIKLFSYGTIQNPAVQVELFGKELDFTIDSINGYKVVNDLLIEDIVYPRLAIQTDGIIQGRVYDLSPEQLAILDEYETDAYRRALMKTTTGCEVQVYFSA